MDSITNVDTVVVVSLPQEEIEVSDGYVNEQKTSQQPDEQTYLNDLDKCIVTVELLTKNIKTLNTDIRTLKKEYMKIIKQLKKRKPKRKNLTDMPSTTVSSDDVENNNTPNIVKKKREPSGFVSPILISDELAVFLGVELGTMMPRTSVTKCINDYIKKHKLQDPKNGKNFDLTNENDPNAQKLKKILNVEVGNEVGYFNLQRYIKSHFISNTNTTKQKEYTDDVKDSNMLVVDTTVVSKEDETTVVSQPPPIYKKKSKRHH